MREREGGREGGREGVTGRSERGAGYKSRSAPFGWYFHVFDRWVDRSLVAVEL